MQKKLKRLESAIARLKRQHSEALTSICAHLIQLDLSRVQRQRHELLEEMDPPTMDEHATNRFSLHANHPRYYAALTVQHIGTATIKQGPRKGLKEVAVHLAHTGTPGCSVQLPEAIALEASRLGNTTKFGSPIVIITGVDLFEYAAAPLIRALQHRGLGIIVEVSGRFPVDLGSPGLPVNYHSFNIRCYPEVEEIHPGIKNYIDFYRYRLSQDNYDEEGLTKGTYRRAGFPYEYVEALITGDSIQDNLNLKVMEESMRRFGNFNGIDYVFDYQPAPLDVTRKLTLSSKEQATLNAMQDLTTLGVTSEYFIIDSDESIGFDVDSWEHVVKMQTPVKDYGYDRDNWQRAMGIDEIEEFCPVSTGPKLENIVIDEFSNYPPETINMHGVEYTKRAEAPVEKDNAEKPTGFIVIKAITMSGLSCTDINGDVFKSLFLEYNHFPRGFYREEGRELRDWWTKKHPLHLEELIRLGFVGLNIEQAEG